MFVATFQFVEPDSSLECHCKDQPNHLTQHQSAFRINHINFTSKTEFRPIHANHHRWTNLWKGQFKSSSLFGRTLGKYEFWLRLLHYPWIIVEIRWKCCYRRLSDCWRRWRGSCSIRWIWNKKIELMGLRLGFNCNIWVKYWFYLIWLTICFTWAADIYRLT